MLSFLMNRNFAVFVALWAVAAILPLVSAQGPDSIDRDYSSELPRIQPLEPKDALGSFRVHPGFRIALVAAEPLVFDPIAMAFDERGRMYVVEMRGYSERREDMIGAIRLLEDVDGDGVFDDSHILADGLAWPTAVACYEGGVFVGVPPDILYMKDTDGDNRADMREVVFSGFGLANVQGLLNSFNWGVDNLIYGATSGSGAMVTSAGSPLAPPLTLHGRDFAIDPRTRRIFATSGGAQHGLTFDDWGHEFVCHNSDHIIQVMFEDRYLARNPVYSAPAPRKSIASDGPQADVFRVSPVEPWRVVRTRLRVKGIVPGPVEGGGTASGYFTSATGVTVYRGDAWPEEYRSNVFVADVGSNLIHRKTLTREGVAFRADRADPGVEFIASTDNWFRPVQFANGPDGCLYVADMYREVIEHPDSLPPVIKKHLDLDSGNDRGRIYRIEPVDFRRPPVPNFGEVSTAELVALLEHSNAWHVETAQRLLFERADPAAVGPLRQLVGEGRFAVGRMRAMYALRSQGALAEDVVLGALNDPDPSVRRHAARLSEDFRKLSREMLEGLARLASDPNIEVRYQVAFTLGAWDSLQRLEALARLAKSDGADPWMTVALMSSLASGAGTVAERLLGDEAIVEGGQHSALLDALARQVGAAGVAPEAERVLAMLERLPAARSEYRQRFIAAMLAGARDAGTGGRIRDVLGASETARETVDKMVAAAVARASDGAAPVNARVDAIQTLAFAPPDVAWPVLEEMYGGDVDPVLRSASISVLSQFDDPGVGEMLIERLKTLPSALLNNALDAVFSRETWTQRFLDFVESGGFDYAALPTTYRHRLQSHASEALRSAAAKLNAKFAPPDVLAALGRLDKVSALHGNADDGKLIFAERCAACHRIGDLGESVGPELVGVREWETARIFTSIVHPNAEINPQYTAYDVETADGRYLTGILDAETATGVTLRMSGGEQTILKTQMRSAAAATISLMPEGLMDDLDAQRIANLIAFVRQD